MNEWYKQMYKLSLKFIQNCIKTNKTLYKIKLKYKRQKLKYYIFKKSHLKWQSVIINMLTHTHTL